MSIEFAKIEQTYARIYEIQSFRRFGELREKLRNSRGQIRADANAGQFCHDARLAAIRPLLKQAAHHDLNFPPIIKQFAR
jgi:hypothetical protein